MITQTNGIVSERLEFLRQREARLKATISAEITLERQRRGRERKRLTALLGAAALEQANRDPGFKIMVQQVLKGAEIDSRDRQFLSKLGW